MQLATSGVCRWFSQGVGLAPISFDVDTGEFVALVGPSGAGKSTLLGIIGGLIRHDSGLITVNGRETTLRERRSMVAWIPQGAHSLPTRTVLDNVMIGALANGESRADAAGTACENLALMGLHSRRMVMARALSGGELQRVALARALATRRPVVLADEPTGNLDRANTKTVVESLRNACSSMSAVIVATHDHELAGAADRVVTLGEMVDG